VRTC